ncbi:1-(5-phosphoribosyl)-5-((5-phosphoribosylamino)methylideneamino)imidazole-4-carboxamide isomerase [Pseudothermotoga sp. U03pept]|uniref:1-(5-phosphoribosyl)-5-((5- phosphoribosylamino)methylideneamino)imidazole-4- carboxamide isomerase n=1 Tax=Pseudothermotoga sp. U03pept TaxID=3447012 RepID=UPI003F06BA87
MHVIPAIDLYKGRVVRMINGVKEKTIIYEKNVLDLVKELLDNSFTLIHLIDLSKAIEERRDNLEILRELSSYADFFQIGGGIRTIEYARELFEMGFTRQIISSKVIQEPTFLLKLQELGIHPIFSLDTRNNSVLYKGWLSEKSAEILPLVEELKKYGVAEIIHTEVEKDGTLQEHDFLLDEALVTETGLQVIAAGGISSERSLRRAQGLYIKTAGRFKGVIVGRAFLEGVLSIEVMKSYAH